MVTVTPPASWTATVSRVSLKMRVSFWLRLPLNWTSLGPGPETNTGHCDTRQRTVIVLPIWLAVVLGFASDLVAAALLAGGAPALGLPLSSLPVSAPHSAMPPMISRPKASTTASTAMAMRARPIGSDR